MGMRSLVCQPFHSSAAQRESAALANSQHVVQRRSGSAARLVHLNVWIGTNCVAAKGIVGESRQQGTQP